MKHTPGPWKYSITHPMSGDVWFVITDNDGRGPIMEIGGDEQNGQIAVAKYLITDPKEIEANARLIAAAPELLEACKQTQYKLIDFIHEIIENDMIVPLWVNNLKDEIDSVIKKATGK